MKFRRSIFVTKDINKGEIFDKENIKIIRPAYGMHPRYYDEILGKGANVDLKAGTPLKWKFIK